MDGLDVANVAISFGDVGGNSTEDFSEILKPFKGSDSNIASNIN